MGRRLTVVYVGPGGQYCERVYDLDHVHDYGFDEKRIRPILYVAHPDGTDWYRRWIAATVKGEQ